MFFRVSVSWNFLILKPRSSNSWNITNVFRGYVFFFFEFGPKSALSSSIIYCSLPNVHNMVKHMLKVLYQMLLVQDLQGVFNHFVDTAHSRVKQLVNHIYQSYWDSTKKCCGKKQVPKVFYKKDVFTDFSKFIEKKLCRSGKVRNLLQKRLRRWCFPVICQIYEQCMWVCEQCL